MTDLLLSTHAMKINYELFMYNTNRLRFETAAMGKSSVVLIKKM